MERFGSPEFDPYFSAVPMYMQTESLHVRDAVNGAGESMARAIISIVSGGTVDADRNGLHIQGRRSLAMNPQINGLAPETNFDGMTDGGLEVLEPKAPVIPLGATSLRGAFQPDHNKIAEAYAQAA